MEDLVSKIVRIKGRRNLALVITKDADFEVRVPLKASLKSIKGFVEENRVWIGKKIEEKKYFINRHRHRVLPREFVEGEEVMYEGNIYKMQISDHEDISVSDVLYFPKKFLPQAKEIFTVWFMRQALKKIVGRINYFSNITQLQYRSIKITNAKGIWGSCSAKGSLRINWRLIMAPPAILDYIVVHELIHLVEKNHSKSYWNKVKEVLPDYKNQEDWLRKNGDILML